MSILQRRSTAGSYGLDQFRGTNDLLAEQTADGPAALWAMQESNGTTMTDSSGNNRSGTYGAGVTLAQSPLTNFSGLYSANFDGSGAAATVTYGSWMDTANLTIEVLCTADSLTSYRGLFHRDDENTVRLWACRFNAGAPSHLSWNTSVTQYSPTGGNNIGTTTVYLIAFRYESGVSCKVFINGSAQATVPVTLGLRTGNIGLAIGTGGGVGPYRWDGRMSHCAYYTSALSDVRLLSHAKAAGVA